MAKKIKQRTLDDVTGWLREHGFEVTPRGAGTLVKKDGCAAILSADAEGRVRVTERPGYLLGGQISRLVDKGYQKFLRSEKLEIPATADHLKVMHAFAEELREALGGTSLYNDALGTVSDRYIYDRVKDRDAAEQPKRPWDKLAANPAAGPK
jgi:hypothetical protein